MSKVTAGILAVSISHIIWGFTTPALKVALGDIPSFSAIFIRFAIASLIVTPLFLSRPYTRIEKQDLLSLFLISSIGIGAHMALFVIGLDNSGVVPASLIIATSPIIDVVAASIFLKERVSSIHKSGITLGVLGSLTLMSVPVFFGEERFSIDIIGNLLLFLSIVIGAYFVIGSKELFRKYTPLTIGTYSFIISALVFLPASIAEFAVKPDWIANTSLTSWAAIVFSGIFASLFAYLLFEWGLSRASVQLIAPTTYLTPIISITIGIALLGEKLHLVSIFSGAIILLGVFLATYQKPHHHVHKRHR